MNFIDGMTLRFRKQGLTENDIRIKLRRYYFYSKLAIVIYLMVFVLLGIFGRFKATDTLALVLFVIWFAVFLMLFLLFRKWTKINGEF